MRYFLINENTPFEIRASLSAYGTCIPLPAFSALPFPVSHHPDMLMAKLEDTIFVHANYEAGRHILKELGVNYQISWSRVGNTYPNDVPLNCFCVGNMLFGGKKSISAEVLDWAQKTGKIFIPVSQGYTKCACAVAGGALVSADRGIVKAAQEAGLSALLLSPQPLGIEVYDTGFIGGACGLLDEHTLGFFGKIEAYPSYAEMKRFFSAVGVELVSLSDAALFDYGGFISVNI